MVRVGDDRRPRAVVDERPASAIVVAVSSSVVPSEGLAGVSTGASLTVSEAVSVADAEGGDPANRARPRQIDLIAFKRRWWRPTHGR